MLKTVASDNIFTKPLGNSFLVLEDTQIKDKLYLSDHMIILCISARLLHLGLWCL